MSCISHTRHILMRDGTNQYERLMEALKPSFVQVDERTREDLMRFVADFSLLVQYYNDLNKQDGNWQDFFDDFSRDHEPHIALMLTFLELYKRAQGHLNEFTLRHLEFYYKKILQIRGKSAQPDKVHLLFELAKNTTQYKLARGTEFKAGKDASGKELIYESESEIVLNKAKVESLKTIFHDLRPEGRLYAAPVANSADGLGADIAGDEPRWFTFGQDQSGLVGSQRTMPDGTTGFALASPLLFLKGGNRIVAVNVQFHNLAPSAEKSLNDIISQNYSGTFLAYLSGEKGWIGPRDVTVTKTAGNSGMVLSIALGPEDDPVVAYNPDILGGRFDTSQPVMKIVLNEAAEPSRLNDLLLLRMKSLNLKVSVTDFQDLVLHSDIGKLDPSKPFQPFGPTPIPGSQFYIGSAEVFGKRLDTLDLRFKWKGLPATAGGFGSYYSVYNTGKTYDTSGYKAAVSLLENRNWIPASVQEKIGLFDLTNSYYEAVPQPQPVVSDRGKKKAGKPYKMKKKTLEMDAGANYIGEVYYPVYVAPVVMVEAYYFLQTLVTGEIRRKVDVGKLQMKLVENPGATIEFGNSAIQGFLKLELSGQDFGHGDFAAVHTQQTIALSKFVMDGGTVGAPKLPNPPYTPVLEYVKIDYSAAEDISISGAASDTGCLFYIEPFGEYAAPLGAAGAGTCLLPQFPYEGSLFIGLKDLIPRQNLSMLFQFAESSSTSETFIEPGELEWSYLSNDQWIPLKTGEVISDSTNGLLTSGIITLDIAKQAGSDNRRMPDGLHWLRLVAKSNALGVNQLIDIKAQAVTAIFKDNGNAASHLYTALPAGSISKLSTAVPGIKKVTQPYASFGGRPEEGNQPFYEPFYTRVSERLRHKGRAITIWDAERMVLQEFPKTYKVKCLNHSSDKNDIAPGHITMVAIENLRNKNAVNPLQPRTSLDTLARIKSYLEKYVSPFVTVNVQNPLYEEVLVDFKVLFHPGYDGGYYKQVLNEEIKKFLSPWAYLEGEDIIFGNVIYKSSILNFIEKREYVDFVTDFKMFVILDSWGIGCMEVEEDFVVGDKEKLIDLDEARAKTSRSILVSAAEHDIYVLSPGEYVCEGVSS